MQVCPRKAEILTFWVRFCVAQRDILVLLVESK